MKRVITYSFGDDLIEEVAELLYRDFVQKGKCLSRVACVFGGRRPGLFLRRSLSQRIKRGYLPPRVFSMEEFVDHMISPQTSPKTIGDLDSAYLIYKLAKKDMPLILSGRQKFSQFLPWAREIAAFIEQLDLEDVDNEALLNVQKSAAIGYEVPASINRLLQDIIKLRQGYHQELGARRVYSRGLKYAAAASLAAQASGSEFDAVLFCNFFYLGAREQKIIKAVYDQGKGVLIFQGSPAQWPLLSKNAKNLGVSLRPPSPLEPSCDFKLYQGFDLHSQVAIVTQIVERLKQKERTVIVLPRPQAVLPLLWQAAGRMGEFNVSMGYPLRRTSLYVLFNLLFKAEESRKQDRYYTRDYINLLKHPLVKNVKFDLPAAATRVLVHKLEELLEGRQASAISGSLFLSLAEIEAEEKIYQETVQTLKAMKIEASPAGCAALLAQIHKLFFQNWQELTTFRVFTRTLTHFLDQLVAKSPLGSFPFNVKVIEKLYEIAHHLAAVYFDQEPFSPRELWEIFRQQLEGKVSFSGSPLKGLQVLGLWETRSLNFDNVIIMDVNESILPRLKIHEPLIPREVMLGLGLDRLEKEEEIQRYQFMRLVKSAKKVHLVYQESQDKERSRFIEELLWARQKQTVQLAAGRIQRAGFSLRLRPPKNCVRKTPQMLAALRQATYSASRIDMYLNCPLQFYYNYVLGLKEKDDLLRSPQASQIGTFIHELLEATFRGWLGRKPVIDARFRKYFFKTLEEKFQQSLARRMKSDSFLLRRIIEARLNKFLDQEAERPVNKIILLEEKLKDEMVVNGQKFAFVYTVDRLDELPDDSIVIIDYKTGRASTAPKRLKGLAAMEMGRASIKENLRSFQLPLYYYFISSRWPGRSVNAELYNIRTLERKSFIWREDDSSRDKIVGLCQEALNYLFSELFDPDAAFVSDPHERRCQFCPFSLFCS